MLPLFHRCCSSACLFIWVINKVGSPVLSLLNSLFSHTECALHSSNTRDACVTSHIHTHRHIQTYADNYDHPPSIAHTPTEQKNTSRHAHIQTGGCIVFYCATSETTEIVFAHILCFVRGRGGTKRHFCYCGCSGELFKEIILLKVTFR